MLKKGYKLNTVKLMLSTVNGFLAYLGLWEFQAAISPVEQEQDIQPELTRNEYLRILSAAKSLRKGRTYLLAKSFACTGISVHELPDITLEAIQAGQLTLSSSKGKRTVPLPQFFRQELLDYASLKSITSGPIFITRAGKLLSRTNVTASIQQLSKEAQVAPEKCNPRCLRKLYFATRQTILDNVAVLIDQAHEQLLEQEQLLVGWDQT